ncbi:hypothetical protein DL89DRAFT_264737 [Linderina pennispora]|uniref:Uncharacterized protein n=1 Tax=Linderina pennispora TaxID=61395 RepID=A0A1Y1WNI9_9FUNG|nr:uncharacterized protein DL89DRAFT_264737 [Linderina pennispora]ORX74945.1 hypothetical protein DL89DRAFT_264737 [Linderina pennispora]
MPSTKERAVYLTTVSYTMLHFAKPYPFCSGSPPKGSSSRGKYCCALTLVCLFSCCCRLRISNTPVHRSGAVVFLNQNVDHGLAGNSTVGTNSASLPALSAHKQIPTSLHTAGGPVSPVVFPAVICPSTFCICNFSPSADMAVRPATNLWPGTARDHYPGASTVVDTSASADHGCPKHSSTGTLHPRNSADVHVATAVATNLTAIQAQAVYMCI